MRKRLGFKDRKNEKKEGKYIQVLCTGQLTKKLAQPLVVSFGLMK